MIPYSGDFAEDVTVYLMFNTFTSNDPSASSTITNFANTDVHIHKDDDLTPRNNAAGITVSVDFDGITGSHMIKIDTNDNTVGGFWVTGKDYFVRIEGTTIDGATVNAVVGHFSIENRYNPVTDYDGPTKAEMDTAHALLSTAAVAGALDDAAADGDPTNAETLMQYLKQLINILVGTAGVVAFPGEAAPANAVSLAEVIRAIHADVTGLNGSAMIGTASAALASVCTEARLAELAAANLPADVDTLLTRITAAVALASICTEGRLSELDAAKLPTDIAAIPTTMVGTDNAALASVCTEARLAELAAANLPADVDAIKAKTDNQPAGVPKNIALSNFMFLMMDSTDHITPKTGLTITEEISKDGGAFAPMTNTFAEVSGGVYKIDITQAERNVDIATLKFTAAGADDRFITIISSK